MPFEGHPREYREDYLPEQDGLFEELISTIDVREVIIESDDERDPIAS